MRKISKGVPAPYDGVILTHHEYNKVINDKKLLNWVNYKLKMLNFENEQ